MMTARGTELKCHLATISIEDRYRALTKTRMPRARGH
jgi:hypothetical protein